MLHLYRRLNFIVYRLFITHADDSRGSKAFSGVWDSVCLFVCSNYKAKTAELKFGYSLSRVLAHQLVLGQKVKGRGHRVTKCKTAIEWPA